MCYIGLLTAGRYEFNELSHFIVFDLKYPAGNIYSYLLQKLVDGIYTMGFQEVPRLCGFSVHTNVA